MSGPGVLPRVASPTYGRSLISSLPADLLERPIVLTQPEPWDLVRRSFREGHTQLLLVESMEHGDVAVRTDAFGAASAVFGIGGGSALDHAKYTAWKRGLPLVLVPTILSADAAFTKAVAVREGARVRYVGEIFPEHLLVDFGLLERAPRVLNLSGVGDILSIFTALWDWQEASERLGEEYDPEIATAARGVLARLLAGAADLGEGSERGLHLLAESYREEVLLCERAGNARPEEGSEHYLAYCLESLTGRHYLHGRLIALCTLLAGSVQGQDVEPVRRFVADIGLDASLGAAGVSRREMRAALLAVGEYVRQEGQLLPGIFHFRGGIAEAEADDLLVRLQNSLGD